MAAGIAGSMWEQGPSFHREPRAEWPLKVLSGQGTVLKEEERRGYVQGEANTVQGKVNQDEEQLRSAIQGIVGRASSLEVAVVQ